MIRMPNFNIVEIINKSKTTTIIRSIRKQDEIPVVLKILNNEYPTAKELSDFKREYKIMNALKGSAAIKPYELLKFNNGLVIVMEDIGGDSVARLLKLKKYTIGEKLSIAVSMADALIQLHNQCIIHKDINPTNFIWNPKTDQVKIIDFGISAELPREAAQSINVGVAEGTLHYISPEQTGRINRPIDFRSDLYSLGVTFYEMFTGRLPFAGNEGLDLIYCHIAKMPQAPIKINPRLGDALSEIIMKLLSKAAEERYQSAYGLKQDLEYCLRTLDMPKRQRGKFIPGQEDLNDRFEIPDKLYGRETELETLLNGFGRAADGGTEIYLVSGYSGIGKSSLIQEIREPIIKRKGFFISGKYSEFDMNIPYSGIAQAFNEFLKQLIIEPQESLENWKTKLTQAVGANGQIIIDLIPELEQIIGPQPRPAELNPLEAQNRFQITLIEFIKVFAAKEHPLVIFLDDIHWCDASSLDLMKYNLSSASIKYLLFIGSYRDNEVGQAHPLIRMLDDLSKAQTGVGETFTQIMLKPLEFSAINQLISDTLHINGENAEPLTNIVFQKTKGNPFFIKRMLNLLNKKGAITYFPETAKWVYDLEKAGAEEISENVVELLEKEFETISEAAMGYLRLAACVGSQFDLKMLSRIVKKPVVELGLELWVAIKIGIIIPLNYNYRLIKTLSSKMNPSDMEFRFAFAHDHLHQAIYSTITEEKRREMHYFIGREYRRAYKFEGDSDAIFELVGHFNMAQALINNKTERIELMKLNTEAGKRAKKSTAFSAALKYFEIAASVLSAEEWDKLRDSLFDIILEQAGTALLSGDLEKSEELCEHLDKKAKTKLQKASVSNIKVLIYLFQGRLMDTIKEGREALSLLGIVIPVSADEIVRMNGEGVEMMKSFLGKNPVEDLVKLPVMKNPEKLMAMQLLFQLAPPAIQADPVLYSLIILIMFELTVKYGTCPLSSKCFGDSGVIMCTTFKDYETGYKLGLAAFELINKFKAESQKPAVYFIFTYISHWRAHLQESLTYYDMSYKSGIETGDLLHATFALSHRIYLMFWAGINLQECKSQLENAKAFLNRTNAAIPLVLIDIVSYSVEMLSTTTNPDDSQLCAKKCKLLIDAIKKSHNMAFLCRIYFFNTFICFIMGYYEAAEKWNRLADEIIYAASSDFPLTDHYLYKGLILVRKYKEASAEDKDKILISLNEIRQKLRYWAENCHENFDHKYFLLSAEMGIIENLPLDTIVTLYNNALENAENCGFEQMKALCCELYANFWFRRGDETIGKAYVREAYYAYKSWGAFRKTVQLEKQFEKHFISADSNINGAYFSNPATTVNSIDKYSILKSAQAISSEIKIEKLLTILISTMIENAGAQRGCLLLKNEADGQFYIEAVKNVNPSYLKVMNSSRFTESDELCVEIVQYVARSRASLVINDAHTNPKWQNNSYITEKRIKSVLCLPVFYQNKIKGIVYLENNLSDNVFTIERLETLKILSSQAAISIENARLYENMEEKVKERTIQLNDANEKLRELSIHDHLTGLHNRRYVYDFANDKIMRDLERKENLKGVKAEETDSDKSIYGVFLIDIDFFKSVNDTYGHSAGDSVLKSISMVLRKHAKNGELVARLGGEEFLLVLYRTKEELIMFSKMLLESIRETPMVVAEGITIYKTISLGYAEMPLDEDNPTLLNLEQMINLSDFALYFAKERSRDCAARFKLNKHLSVNDEIKNELINLSKNSVLNTEHFVSVNALGGLQRGAVCAKISQKAECIP